MSIRKLTEKEVEFRIEVELDDLLVRGHFDSGDDSADKEIEDGIINRMMVNDVWAWAYVRVVASWRGYEGSDTLGACTYANEEDFKTDDYYTDMKLRALSDLNSTLKKHADVLFELIEN